MGVFAPVRETLFVTKPSNNKKGEAAFRRTLRLREEFDCSEIAILAAAAKGHA
jgi:hypothetical protein